MRKDSRHVLLLGLALWCGGVAAAAQSDGVREEVRPMDDVVVLTVEIGWGIQDESGKGNEGAGEITAQLTQGHLVDVVRWPRDEIGTRSRDSGEDNPIAVKEGMWRIGRGRQGRVRARIQAPLKATLLVRGGDQTVSLPLMAVLDKPQRTPAKSPLQVRVERLPWDALVVDLIGDPERGIVGPGARARVSVGVNLIWPESTRMTARLTGVLHSIRSGEELWRHEQHEEVEANAPHPALWVWDVPAPAIEGTYILEVKATWAPAVQEGTRIGRLIRRRWPPASTSATRRVVLTVLDPKGRGATAGAARETEVDSLDFTRGRGHRLLASGRAPTVAGRSTWRVPAEALIEPSRRDRLRGWILRTLAEAARLEPADSSGLAWSAVGLKVMHPERPHRLTVTIKGGEPSALGVALIEPGGAQGGPRLVLDACASGPTLLEDGPPAVFHWLVWPSATEEVLVLVNRAGEGPVRLGSASLTELADVSGPALEGEDVRPARVLGLYLAGERALETFSVLGGRDLLATAGNLADYLAACGARAVVLPEGLADRSRRRALSGQLEEDPIGPDQLDVVERVLERRGVATWLEVDLGGPEPLPGLPPADSLDAAARGLVRIDQEGRSLPVYHPLNPEVRAAMKARITRALDHSGRPPAAGVVIRLGAGATLLGTPDTGLDDATFARFIDETYSGPTAANIPGAGTAGPDRFLARSRYLAGLGRMPWLNWRSRAIASLYYELAETVRTAAPGALLAVATPSLDDGLAGAEARRVDRAGLAPSQAWRALGLDLQNWPRTDQSPLVLRGLGLSTEPLAHDLAVSPDLDALVADREGRGVLLSVDDLSPGTDAILDAEGPLTPGPAGETGSPNESTVAGHPAASAPVSARGRAVMLSALPLGEGAAADLPLAHALAALDSRYVFLDAKVVAGHEDRIRRYAAVLRALPAWPATTVDPVDLAAVRPFGVVARTMTDPSRTFLEIANDSPFPVRLAGVIDGPTTAVVDDLGRGARLSPEAAPGGRQLVLDLLPHGVAAIRVGTAGARFLGLTPYPSPAVLTDMRARFNDLSAQLAQLNRSSAAPVVMTSGFESVATGSDAAPDSPTGFSTSGPGAAEIAVDGDNPHAGQGSLRFKVDHGPASATSEPFTTRGQSSLTLTVSLRGSTPDLKARVWIEGQSGGRPYVRSTELAVATSWTRQAVRASEIHVAGLESARVRFELAGPGTLWIDDLKIEGEPSPRGGRQSAQRALLAALQAYREARYADFARLAESHWIRETAPIARLARTNPTTPNPDPEKTTDDETSSPLPRNRALR